MPRLFIASGIFHPESGGPATYLYELLPELQRLGWDVRALSYGDAPAGAYPYPLARIPRRALPARLAAYALAARPRLAWADLVYIHSLDLPLFGSRRARRVVKIVGDPGWERAIRKGWIPPTEDIDVFQTRRYGSIVTVQQDNRARQVRSMDGVIVPSVYLKKMVLGWGVNEAKIRVIYNALPPEQTDAGAPPTQAEARARLGLDDNPILLTAARLTPWKGVDHLITALRRVPDVRLLVAGDGDQLEALREQARAAGLSGRVVFLGKVPREQMALYMKAADYLALYSGYEGLSHTLLESLRAGTPVIASDKGGNPEVVRHGVNGLLVPYINVEALAAALTEAFRPGRRVELAAQTGIGMERFDFCTMVQQTDAALRAYLG
ncbi:MAG: glycosyltransferase family 4 protein [Chloroflexi bacterium]|nr:glycosyltransferase family 4 protein [Chloroflexota bacterium]